jgi:hypothetical protein
LRERSSVAVPITASIKAAAAVVVIPVVISSTVPVERIVETVEPERDSYNGVELHVTIRGVPHQMGSVTGYRVFRTDACAHL